jgi:uncharacterized protein
MKKALIFWGGWDGHQPELVAALFRGMLENEGFSVVVSASQDVLADRPALEDLDLIVPIWTMGKIEKDHAVNVAEAVAGGVGLAGCHGGMCDAFRENVLWQFMTGANWVAHPGGDGVEYKVNVVPNSGELTDGIGDFDVKTEQYYLQVDPANVVLATTRFPTVNWYHSANGPVDVPVAWTRKWGIGRVYYNALGHQANVIDHGPAKEMLRRGMIWASEGRAQAKAAGLTKAMFEGATKNY